MDSLVLNTSELSKFAKSDDWSTVDKLCGQRASYLSQLQYHGFDIPKSIVLTTEAYRRFSLLDDRSSIPDELFDEIYKGIHLLEEMTKKQFGTESLLLLSISSNFPIPSAICIGLNDYFVQILEKQTNNKRFSYDCYRRLVESYGIVACGIPESVFDKLFYDYKCSRNYKSISDFTAFDFIQLLKMNKAIITQEGKRHFPQDPEEQLRDIICGMYHYYEDDRDVDTYFKSTFASDDGCTILINSMVYGAKNPKSCSIIAATNDTAGGDYGLFGYYQLESFLDDVAERRRAVKPISELENDFPKAFTLLNNKIKGISKRFKRPMELKLIIENERLYVVGIKPEHFGGLGHITAAMEYQHLNILSTNDIIANFDPYTLECVLHYHLTSLPDSAFCSGASGVHGSGTGPICFEGKGKKKKNSIMFKRKIYLSDINEFPKYQAYVTSEGGGFSRGTYIARALSVQGAFGCECLLIEPDRKVVSTEKVALREGKNVTVDFGDCFVGSLDIVLPDSILNADVAALYDLVLKATKGKFKINMNAPNSQFVQMANVLCADSIGNFPFESISSSLKDNFVEMLINDKDDLPENVINELTQELAKVFVAADKLPVSVQLFDFPLSTIYQTNQKIEDELRSLFRQREKITITRLKLEEKRAEYEQQEAQRKAEEEARQKQLAASSKGKKQPKTAPKQEAPKPEPVFLDENGEKLELPPPEKEAEIKDRIEKFEKIINLRINSIHASFVYPKLFEIQVKIILKAAQTAKEAGAEPKPKVLLPFANDEKDLMKLSTLISSLAKENQIKTEFGCIGLSPSNIAMASKVVNFIFITPHNLFQSGDAPYFIDNTLWHPPSPRMLINNLLSECIKCAFRKKKQLPIIISGDNFRCKESVDELMNLGITSLSTNPMNIIIARFCAAQSIISRNVQNEEDEEPQEE